MRTLLTILLFPIVASAIFAQTDTSRIVWQIGGGSLDEVINDALLTEDESSIITAGDRGELRVWSVRETVLPRVVEAHTGSARAVQLDDSTILSGGYDGYLRIWDWPGMELRREVQVGMPVSRLWRIVGDSIVAGVVGEYSNLFVTIDLATGDTTLVRVFGTYDEIIDVDPTSGRGILARQGEDSALVFDARTGVTTYAVPWPSFTYGDIASGGELMVFYNAQLGRCEWRRLSDGALVDSGQYDVKWGSSIRVDRSASRCLVFSADGVSWFTRGDTTVTTHVLRTHGGGPTVSGGFVGVSDTVWVVGMMLLGAPYQERFPSVVIIDPTGNAKEMAWLNEPVHSVVFIDGDSTVRVGTLRQSAKLEMGSGRLRTLDQGMDCKRVAAIDGQYESYGSETPEAGFSGRVVYRRIDGGYSMLIVDHLTGVEVGLPAPGGDYHYYRGGLWQRRKDSTVALPPSGPLMFSYDATLLATGSSSGDIIIYRTEDLTPLPAIETISPPRRLMFSRDGLRIASLGLDSAISVFDVAGGSLVRRLDTRGLSVSSFVFSSRGTHLVVGSESGAITVWDIANGELIETLQQNAPVTCVDVTADGQWIVSGAEDATVTMWRPRGRVGSAPEERHGARDGQPMLRAR